MPGLRLIPHLLLIAAGILAHGHDLDAPFVFDDMHAIVENEHLVGGTLRDAFAAPPESSLSGRPIASASFAAIAAVWGLDPTAHHAANLALHVLAAILLLDALRLGLRAAGHSSAAADVLATAAALLWVVHPLGAEGVHYAVQRTEVLLAVLAFACIAAALRARTGGTPWAVVSVVAAALAMGTKESAVVLPVIVVLMDWALPEGPRRAWLRARRPLHAALGATWILLALLMATSPRGASVGLTLGVTPAQYLANQASELLGYARLVAWPTPLLIDYGMPWPPEEHIASIAAGFIVLTAALAVALLTLRRRPAIGLLAVLPFVLLAPTSSIVPIVTEVAAERRMLLPLAPIAMLVVLGADSARRRTGIAAAPALLLLVLGAGALGLRSAARAEEFADPVRLWSIAADARPGNARAWANLGHARQERGDMIGAVAGYRRAVELGSNSALVYSNLGAALIGTGAIAEAVPILRQASELVTEDPRAVFNLGVALELARDGAAVDAYREALARDAEFVPALINLANALRRSEPQSALDAFLRAAALEPDRPEPWAGAAWLLATQPTLRQARGFPPEEAVRLALESVRAGGRQPVWLEALAIAEHAAGRRDDALRTLEEALAGADRMGDGATADRVRRLREAWR